MFVIQIPTVDKPTSKMPGIQLFPLFECLVFRSWLYYRQSSNTHIRATNLYVFIILMLVWTIFNKLIFLPKIWIVLDLKFWKMSEYWTFFPFLAFSFPFSGAIQKSNHLAIRQFENRTSPIFRSPCRFIESLPRFFIKKFLSIFFL